MKKIVLSCLLAFVALSANAQVEFGFQFSPSLSTTRLESKTEDFSFDNYKSGVRFNTGFVLDLFLKDNIAVSTGLTYAVKRTGVTVGDTTSIYNLVSSTQYLQIPVSVKLFTPEIMADTRLFLNIGASPDFKISSDKIKSDIEGGDIEDVVNPETYAKIFDASFVIGIGGEKKIGSRNKVFGGLYYTRGLVSMLTKDYNTQLTKDNLNLNSDQFSLMIGYKF